MRGAKTRFTTGFFYSNIIAFQVRDLNGSGRFPDFKRWMRKYRTENVSLYNRLLCLPRQSAEMELQFGQKF